MFVMNGIVYASEISDNIHIVDAKPLEDMMMILTFSTGEQRLFDATVLSGPAFEPLSNPEIFDTCRIVHGVVTWMDEEIDCAPEYMYEKSYPYIQPEAAPDPDELSAIQSYKSGDSDYQPTITHEQLMKELEL